MHTNQNHAADHNTDGAQTSRRALLKASASAGLLLAAGVNPALGLRDTAAGFGNDLPTGGSLETSLFILNYWQKKPEAVNALYAAIYNALEKDPKATYRSVSVDPDVRRLAEQLDLVHLGGPMLGQLSPRGATVWVRTLKPASVEVRAAVDGKQRTFGPVQATFDTDLCARVAVTGLEPDTTTPYTVYVDGRLATSAGTTQITTPPNTLASPTRIMFGTCPHRWGLGNDQLMASILARKPHAAMLYGDIAVQGRRGHLGLHRADYAMRDLHPAWQTLVSQTPVYTSWDDHDYFHNDQWGIPRQGTAEDRVGIRDVYRYAWNNTSYGTEQTHAGPGEGIFQHATVGAVDLIMTDNRYFRQREGKHCFLGEAQMAWLQQTLRSCKGQFIIISSCTMWSDYVSNGKDSWGRYDPQAREQIFSLIEEENIPGVLLVSGDRHGARAFTIPRPSGYSFYEFEPACLGGRAGPPAKSNNWSTQLYGYANRYAFGEFVFDTDRDDPTVTHRLIAQDASVLEQITLTRSQLTPRP